jgi:hypothetical protein
MKRILTLGILAALAFTGCVRRYGSFPSMTIAGPGLEGDTFSPSDYQLTDKEVEEKDISHIIIFFPIAGPNQKHVLGYVSNAVNRICEEKGYSFLTNVRIYYQSWYIPYIYGQTKILVRGEGWTKQQGQALMEELNRQGIRAELEAS